MRVLLDHPFSAGSVASEALLYRAVLTYLHEAVSHEVDLVHMDTGLGTPLKGDSHIPFAFFNADVMPLTQSLELNRFAREQCADALVTARNCVLSETALVQIPTGWTDLLFGVSDTAARDPFRQSCWSLANTLVVESQVSKVELLRHVPQISGEVVAGVLTIVRDGRTPTSESVPELRTGRRSLRKSRPLPSPKPQMIIFADQVDELLFLDLERILLGRTDLRVTVISGDQSQGPMPNAESPLVRVTSNLPRDVPRDVPAFLASNVRAPLSALLWLLKEEPNRPIAVPTDLARLLPKGTVAPEADLDSPDRQMRARGFHALDDRARALLGRSALQFPGLVTALNASADKPMITALKEEALMRMTVIANYEF